MATMTRRPRRQAVEQAIRQLLRAEGQPEHGFDLVEDGDDESAPGKCGWAFWLDGEEDSTSYVHEDLTIERY
jgi:hypothetical protein